MVSRSKNLIVQITAAPDAPVLKLRACNFKYVTMEWTKPMCYGDALVIAYKVYVDGKVEAVLAADQQSFTLTKGEACHEYAFQVQAMTAEENLSSRLSNALKVVWPGIKLPPVRVLDDEGGGVCRVAWDEPVISGNAKISFYRVVAESEQTGQAVIVGPLDSHMHEAEFSTLASGRYRIHLEVNAYGSTEPFVSQPVFVDFGHRPDAPHLTVQVFGLEERKRLDRIASSLANKRDRLLRIVTSTEVKDNVSLSRAMSTLRQLDDALNDCLKMIAHFSGFFIVNLSWTCYQPNPMIKLLGFRVFINDQQYGVDLHESIRTIRVKLSLERAVHTIYVTGFTDHAQNESQNSNIVELLSENFFPFTFYCFNNVHHKNKSWPEKGCCAYQDTLPIERSNLSKAKELVHYGLLNEPVSFPRVELFDLVSKKTRSLIEGRSRMGNKPTVLLFWTKWCLSSIRTLNFFIMYSKMFNIQAEFIACHYGHENTTELLDLLKKAGYLDTAVKFVIDIKATGKKRFIILINN